ncbi:MAG: hypothetical protein KQI62_18940 [Deltaproteobacteria bacterium]|nr:hypothetical protein [Deltaproteobacteria bacterium]
MSSRLPMFIAAMAAAVFVSLAAAAPAPACCIYNNTTLPLQAQSYISGMHEWIVQPSTRKCTDATCGKEVTLCLVDALANQAVSTHGKIWVSDRGWISVYKKSGGKWKVVSKTIDGSLHATIYLEPQPK